MTIIKVEKRDDPYARIDNKTLQDSRLSFKATGLLAYLLSLPRDWHVVLAHLCTVKTDGLHAVQTAFEELKRCSYAKFERPRDHRGRFGGSVWRVFERPFTGKAVFPLSENSDFRETPVSEEINAYKQNDAYKQNGGHKQTMHDHEGHAPSRGAEEEELTPEQRDLLSQIEELTRSENRTEKFRRVWTLKVRDHEIVVFQAIAETKRMKRERQIKQSIGGALNWNYKFFLAAAEKRKRLKNSKRSD